MTDSAYVRPGSPGGLVPAAAGAAAQTMSKGASSRPEGMQVGVSTANGDPNGLGAAEEFERDFVTQAPAGQCVPDSLEMMGAQPELPFAAATPTATAVPAQAHATVAVTDTVHPLPSTLLPAVGTSDTVTSDVLGVLGAWYAMYQPAREAQLQTALRAGFDSKTSFEDNFLQVTGHDQLNALFYVLQRCVDHMSIAMEKVEVLAGDTVHAAAASGAGGGWFAQRAKPPGVYQLRILGRHAFYLPKTIRGPVTSWFLPPALVLWATDVLTVRQSDNKIVHWQQRVHNIPVAPGVLRWSIGQFGSLVAMHALGW